MAIDYTVRRLHDPRDGYAITLRFNGDASGQSVVHLPGEYADARQAERGIEALTVDTDGARIEDTDDPAVKRIHHRPGAALTVRYVLRQIAPGMPDAAGPSQYFPVIQPAWFEWIGWTTWVVPADDETRVRIRVHFADLPRDWNFASSFGLDPRDVAFDGSAQQFRQSIFVGGDFRLRSRRVRGGQLVTATRGEWGFRDSELADRVATVVDGERAFWRDDTQRDFLVVMIPLTAPSANYIALGGTGLTRSFVTFTTPLPSLLTFETVTTHEYFHTWNPFALGTVPEPDASMKWFYEGFTDYYRQQLLLRWKMITLEQYAAAYDKVLQSVAHAREGELPNAEIGPRYFSEGASIGKLPYWRGMLLAAKWDAEIRTASHGQRSLDDAMRTLLAERRAGVKVLDAARVIRVMQSAGVVDAVTDVAVHVDLGRRLRLADGVLGACVRIATVDEVAFDPGFNIERSMHEGKVIGVDPGGGAHAAGLRDDQPFVSTDLGWGTDVVRSDREGHVTVREGTDGSDRVVTVRPVERPIARQQTSVIAGLDPATRLRCLAALRAE